MYYQMRHVAAKLRQDEVMMRAMMPTVSEADLEPLTIYQNDRTSERKTLTYSVSDVMRSALIGHLDSMGGSDV
jgi:hypothetical protein